MNKKVVLITVARGFIVRNILRSGVLEILKKAGFKIVIFFGKEGEDTIPKYLRDEFENEDVVLENVPLFYRKGYIRFERFAALFISSRSSRHHSDLGNKRNLHRAFYWKYVEMAFSWVSNKLHFLKTLVRYIERKVFINDLYAPFFEKHDPSIVFSTSIQSRLDINVMKEAQKRGIPTVAMPKGWDNVTKLLYSFVPDIMIVHNERMKIEASRIQRIPKGKITVTGFPQFDWYKKPEILLSREEFCNRYGLDPKKKIIFFGSEGRWAPGDGDIISLLIHWINTQGALAHESQLIIRPHFSDVKSNRLMRFNGMSRVVVDDNITPSNFFGDNWDPSTEETKLFTNLIYHTDILIAVASTLTLDGVCFNKPLINVAFNVLIHPKTGKDISHLLYEQDHYDWVLETGAVDYVRSKDELLESINAYLTNPSLKDKERRDLLKKLCYKVDGNSSGRIVKVLVDVLAKQ